MNKITILLLAILLVSASALKFRQPPANATEGGQGPPPAGNNSTQGPPPANNSTQGEGPPGAQGEGEGPPAADCEPRDFTNEETGCSGTELFCEGNFSFEESCDEGQRTNSVECTGDFDEEEGVFSHHCHYHHQDHDFEEECESEGGFSIVSGESTDAEHCERSDGSESESEENCIHYGDDDDSFECESEESHSWIDEEGNEDGEGEHCLIGGDINTYHEQCDFTDGSFEEFFFAGSEEGTYDEYCYYPDDSGSYCCHTCYGWEDDEGHHHECEEEGDVCPQFDDAEGALPGENEDHGLPEGTTPAGPPPADVSSGQGVPAGDSSA